jgi:hypothetical protein
MMNPLYKFGLYAVLLVGLVLAAYTALSIHDKAQQKIGGDRVQVAWDAQVVVDRTAVAERTIALQKEKDDAEIQAKIRIDAATHAAAVATASSKLLDSTLKSVLAASSTASAEADRKYISTLTAVFGECKDRYRSMGQEAQGHANDSLMYQNAWPRIPNE